MTNFYQCGLNHFNIENEYVANLKNKSKKEIIQSLAMNVACFLRNYVPLTLEQMRCLHLILSDKDIKNLDDYKNDCHRYTWKSIESQYELTITKCIGLRNLISKCPYLWILPDEDCIKTNEIKFVHEVSNQTKNGKFNCYDKYKFLLTRGQTTDLKILLISQKAWNILNKLIDKSLSNNSRSFCVIL